MLEKAGAAEGKLRGSAGWTASALWDALVFLAVLLFSAFAIIFIAVAAPLAITVSAIAGAFSPAGRPRRWRDAHAG
jgi:hypothetical protein